MCATLSVDQFFVSFHLLSLCPPLPTDNTYTLHCVSTCSPVVQFLRVASCCSSTANLRESLPFSSAFPLHPPPFPSPAFPLPLPPSPALPFDLLLGIAIFIPSYPHAGLILLCGGGPQLWGDLCRVTGHFWDIHLVTADRMAHSGVCFCSCVYSTHDPNMQDALGWYEGDRLWFGTHSARPPLSVPRIV